ncbi:hypothetical protein JCM8097_006003 [Rhodosporidiobolus ruineniae]
MSSLPNIPAAAPAVLFTSAGGEIKYVEDHPVIQPSELKPGEVLVRVEYSGVCQTDYHVAKGHLPILPQYPIVGGHEGAGRVVAIGAGTHTTSPLNAPVGLKWIASTCSACSYCLSGSEHFCPTAGMSGFTRPGTFQRYVVVDEKALVRLPSEGVRAEEAAVMMCAGVTAWKAVKKANVNASSWLVISGAGGGIGHLATQFAVHGGIKVVAIDRGDKRELVEGYGVEKFLDFEKYEGEGLAEEVKRICDGIGAHAAIVAATAPDAYQQAADFLRPRGTLVAVTVSPSISLNGGLFLLKGLNLVALYAMNQEDTAEALEMLKRGKVRPEVEVRELRELSEVFDRMEKGQISGRIVLKC